MVYASIQYLVFLVFVSAFVFVLILVPILVDFCFSRRARCNADHVHPNLVVLKILFPVFNKRIYTR